MSDVKDKENLLLDQDQYNVKNNIATVMLYALSLTTVLGFRDLIIYIFNSFEWTGSVLANTTYIVIMFSVTIWLAYYLKANINK
jgi:hypothetical protein